MAEVFTDTGGYGPGTAKKIKAEPTKPLREEMTAEYLPEKVDKVSIYRSDSEGQTMVAITNRGRIFHGRREDKNAGIEWEEVQGPEL